MRPNRNLMPSRQRRLLHYRQAAIVISRFPSLTEWSTCEKAIFRQLCGCINIAMSNNEIWFDLGRECLCSFDIRYAQFLQKTFDCCYQRAAVCLRDHL